MSIVNRLHQPGPALSLTVLVVVAVLPVVFVDALPISCRNDVILFDVDTDAISRLSPVFAGLAAESVRVIRLCGVDSTQVKLINDFCECVADQHEDVAEEAARAWVQDRLATMSVESQCRLYAVSKCLQVSLLPRAIMSTKTTWNDISVMRWCLDEPAFFGAVGECPAMLRLTNMADTTERVAIATAVHHSVVDGGGPASAIETVRTAVWEPPTSTIVHWARSNDDAMILDLLEQIPGLTRAPSSSQPTCGCHIL
ncbi:Secreted protein [Plasmodiophora brassicae]|uniref:Uncharacterized protein n=1 Tax=Plasmodiophora brassicae TaxID=37360 RepID=A0A0G4J590_PLABS|nr:hypothetical protein PBRA_009045 [Plasmodiophora brassicae]